MRYLLILFIILMPFSELFSQNLLNGRLSGNFQIEMQSYKKDSLIDAPEVAEKVRSNAYMNLIYNTDDFEFGLRYEAYMNPILGFDPRYEGNGIPFRYGSYRSDFIDITVGDFYEQFGSGMIFRAYEERQLGLDNAVDGVRVKVRPTEGISITGLIGKQRTFWEKSDGILRGGDINIALNDLFENTMPESILFSLGGSVISRYQEDRESFYHLPENVLSYSARAGIMGDWFSLDGEYDYKYNDPNATNNFSYNPGYGLIVNGSVFAPGFGFSLNVHKIDNMDFRTERNAIGNNLLVGYIPPLTKQHLYRLAGMYPYSTQLNGEAGIQAELTYRIPRKTTLGGPYGTNIELNYSRVQSIDTTHINEFEYDSPAFGVGDELFFQDFNIQANRKWSKKFKTIVQFVNLIYNKDVLESGGASKYGKLTNNIFILDMQYRFNRKHALKTKLQHMWSKQDSAIHTPDNQNGNWAMILAEYTISPSWFLTVYDEYNYGNDDPDLRIHYLNGSIAYVHNTTRVSIGYGRQRGGLLCVGGVCRQVPASNGFYLSVSSSF